MKYSCLIIPVIAILFTLSSCGNSNDPEAKSNSKEEAVSNQKEENDAGSQEKKLSPKEMTHDVGLSASEIDSLYNEPILTVDEKDRPVNSLSAFDYIRLNEEYSEFQRFFERYEPARKLALNNKRIVVFGLSNSTLEEHGLTNYFREITNGNDEEAKKQLLYSHVFSLEGKYLGGDFIYISDIQKKTTYKLIRKRSWYYKSSQLSDPNLVFNGIVFDVKNNPWL